MLAIRESEYRVRVVWHVYVCTFVIVSYHFKKQAEYFVLIQSKHHRYENAACSRHDIADKKMLILELNNNHSLTISLKIFSTTSVIVKILNFIL